MNKILIEALTLLSKYQNTDDVVNYPVRCLHEELIVKVDDINEVSYEDMMKLMELHFYPGCDDDFNEILNLIHNNNIPEGVWYANRSSYNNCFHSYRFA